MKRSIYSLSLLLTVAWTSLAAVPPPERLLPADTVAVFTIPDYAKASAIWAKWPAHQIWQDPAMKPFKDKFTAKFNSDVLTPLEEQLGIKFADFSGLAQGQMTLAITRMPKENKEGKKAGFLFLMDSRGKSTVLSSNLTDLKRKWVEGGNQLRSSKIRNVDFTTLIFKPETMKKTLSKVFPVEEDEAPAAQEGDDEEGKDAEKGFELTVGQSDSLLIIGDSIGPIEKVLANQSGGSGTSLSDQQSFTGDYAALFKNAQLYAWINAKTIIDTIRGEVLASQKGAPAGGPNIEKILDAVGINALQTAAFNIQDTEGGVATQIRVNVPQANRKGLFKIFNHEAKDASPLPFVPADVVKFSRWRLDLKKTWATLESTIAEISPQLSTVVKMVIDNAGRDTDPDFNLRKNLIANLGDDLVSYERAPRTQTLAGLNSPPKLFLVSSARAEEVASAINALGAVMPQPKVKEREFLGRKVLALNLPPAQLPNGQQVERVLHYAGSGDYVALSMDVSMLEEFLRHGESTPKPLRNLPGLREAADKVGGMNSGLFGFENQKRTMRSTVETLRKESGTLANLFGGSPLAGSMADGAGKLQDWVDFSLLPPFERIEKYFYIGVWSGRITPAALSFKGFAPHPPNMGR
jgi:hypothetical protein